MSSSATGSRGAVLPPHVFAPYYSNSADTLAATSRASGAKYLTLAFLQTARPGSCTVVWNGDPRTPVGRTYAAGIAAVQRAGGNVVPSFGGASADSDDEEIADSCHSVGKIAGQYEKVIRTYHVTRLDLDTEEDSLNNYAGINRRNEAIAMVEQWAKRTRRTVQFVYTIPTNASGIDQGGSVVLQNAIANHARIAVIDIMTFDYYDNLPHEMADNTEGAAQQLFDRLRELYPGKTVSQLWAMIGICEDLGVDDYGPAETFTLADARTVERWAASRGLGELSFWNVQDDNSAGSQQKQSPYQYSHILDPFTSWTPVPGGAAPAPGAGPQPGPDHQSGNFRSVSCPTPTFCMAVDESGNNALTWNGTSWSRPVSIDPGGFSVELTSVSCATPVFCAAVDTLGRAVTWNGRRWSAPREVDPRGAGLESVSCPRPSFCEAVDGNGNGLTWTGRSWTRPVRIDHTGTGIQSVSCASARFCAAGDWGGSVVTWNGRHWSKPRLVDPTTATTGGGIGSLSCPTATFCVAVDWNGGSITYNGKAWKLDKTFDPNGAEGLMEVSCPTASFCMAVDGGDDLIWTGHSWTSPDLIDVTGDGIESVSCGSSSSCMVVDWDGNALHWTGGSWPATAVTCPDTSTKSAGDCTTTGSYADPRTGVLDSVSCPTASFCAAVDGNGNALTTVGRRGWHDPAVGRPVTIDPIAGILTSVSCTSASFCVAVDGMGRALTWNGLAWSQPAWSTLTPADRSGGAITAVSCADITFCAAVDGNGRELTWTGSSWSAPHSIDPDGGGLTSVSCPTASFCAAVDADGRSLTWNGTSWSAARSIDPEGGGLTGVSCASASFCVAVDGRGRILAGNAHSWSAPDSVDADGGGLTGVSCVSASRCAAVDAAGRVLTWNGTSWSAARSSDPDGGGLTAVSCTSAVCVATDFDGRTVRFRLH